MDFYKVVDKVVDLLRSRGRVTYSSLKIQFQFDDAQLAALREEILYAHESSVQADDRGFMWIGDTEDIQVTTTSQLDQPEPQPTAQEEQPTQIASQPVESHQPDAERRQLTILFTDLVDSTALSGQFDAEEYREIVRAYQTACAEVIELFDCTLVQTLGDGLLIYSGYPVAHDNDAERAVRTGLGILDAMKTLNERLEQEKGIRLAVRVGIHTGSVVIGDVGAGSKHEQLALGEVPNVAARIQGLAEPDTVVISTATYRLVEGYIDCETLGEQTLRGVADPIAVYRVLNESGLQNRLDIVSMRGFIPLVGRHAELQLLIDRWQQAKAGEGQVVLLNAEPGLGKSRMVQALREHLVDEAYTRLECRSSPYYQNTALYPITDLLQRTLQWHQDDTPEQHLEKLEQALRQYRLPVEESVQLFAPLVSVSIPENRYPPLKLSPQRQRQKTLEAIVTILLEQAEQQPVLFILEDLHWTDPSTLELLDLLIAQTPTASILVLLTCRPEFQPTWAHRSYLTELMLSHLSRNQIERLAEHVADGKRLPAAVLEQITEKTDGVPLYVEEMTKSVLESGVLKDVDGHYELRGTVASLSIPSTLQDSLMSRLDRLVTAKAVAQYASVIGRQFSYELLQAVSQLDQTMLQHELGRLAEAELVYQRGLPPHATYIFKHALVSDIAYQSLLRSTRQGYHRRIAEVLEEWFPETVDTKPELLAHHFAEAGLHKQAVGYWQRAGEYAIQRAANVEAIRHFQRGLEQLASMPDSSDQAQQELTLLTHLGPVLRAVRGPASSEVESVYTRAYTLCQQIGDHAHLFPVLRGLANFYTTSGDLQTGRKFYEQSLTTAEQLQDASHLMEAHQALGVSYLYGGDFPSAWLHLQQSLTFHDPTFRPALHALHDLAVFSLGYGALTLWFLGYPDQAWTNSCKALARAQELSHPYSIGWGHIMCAWIAQRRREFQRTHAHAEAAIEVTRQHGFMIWQSIGMILQGWVAVEEGQRDSGTTQIREGIDAVRATKTKAAIPVLLQCFGEVLGKTGHVTEGVQVLNEALVLADHQTEHWTEHWYEAELHRLKGELLLQKSPDNHTEAEICFHKAITIAQSQSAKSWELRAATSLSRLWQSQGKREEAYDLLEPVYAWFTEGFDTADLKDAKVLLDELA